MNRLVIETPNQKNAEKYRPNKDTTVKKIAAALCLACLTLCATAARADVKLPPVISDHMVLQRDVAAPMNRSPTRRAFRAGCNN